jgi:hypothetical protein
MALSFSASILIVGNEADALIPSLLKRKWKDGKKLK